MLEALIQKIKGLFDKDSSKLVGLTLPSDRVDMADDYVKLKHGQHYVKLWLSEMYLNKSVEWMTQIFPALHALVRFDFGDKRIEVPSVADASRIGLKDSAKPSLVFARNFELTPYIPFNNGTVELTAGLAVVKGENYAKTLISTLSSFAELLAVPQFSSALKIATPLATGMQGLLSESDVRLGLHQTLTAGNTGGYFVVLGAEEGLRNGQVDPTKLLVKNNALRYGPTLDKDNDVPFIGIDYLLFRIEVIETLPDSAWRNMANIAAPITEMRNAFRDNDTTKLQTYFRAACVAVMEAKELTDVQRTQALKAVEAEYERLSSLGGKKGLVAMRGDFDLAQAIKGGISVSQARRTKPRFPALAATSTPTKPKR